MESYYKRSQRKKRQTIPQPIKETGGRAGLTFQVKEFLQWAERIYGVWWLRNHQGLGSTKGTPDYFLGFPIKGRQAGMEIIAVELKSPRWNGRLDKYKEKQKDRIERAAGQYFIVCQLDGIVDIFRMKGYDKIQFTDEKPQESIPEDAGRDRSVGEGSPQTKTAGYTFR